MPAPPVAEAAPVCKPTRPSDLREPVPDLCVPTPWTAEAPTPPTPSPAPVPLCRMEAKFSPCWTPLPDAVTLWIRSVPVTLRGQERKPAHQKGCDLLQVPCPVLFPRHRPHPPGSAHGTLNPASGHGAAPRTPRHLSRPELGRLTRLSGAADRARGAEGRAWWGRQVQAKTPGEI